MRRLVFSYVTNLAAYGPVRLIAAVGMIIVCSLTEGVSIAFLIPVLQAAGLDLENQTATESIAKAVTLGFAVFGAQPTLPLLLMIFISIVGARSLLSRAQSVAIFAVEQHFVLALRQRLHQAITNADWLFLCRSRSTDFTHALTEEAARLGGATFVLLTLAADLTVSAVFVVLAFALSGIITVLVLGAGALLLVAHHQMVHKIHSAGNELSAALKAFYAATIDQMESLKAAKASSAQERSIVLFTGAAMRLSAAYTAISRHQAATGSWFEIGSTVALCLMLYIAVAMIRLPASAILTLLLIFWRLMPRLTSAHQHLRSFASVLPAFGTVIDMTKRCEEVAEPPQPTGPLLALTHTLRFEGVCFSYRAGGTGVRDIDLVIEQGTIVALVGPSGVGKSTILDLAMGLLSPHSGRIVIDGVPLTLGNARGWRHQLGYVGPETTLFHLSVRNNLLWAQPKATDGEIFEALRLAAAEALVLSLPEGLDTLIGDRGVLLSQGECQRLALARALLRRPRLLILDEATNNLDVETEILVMQALRRDRAEMTVLLTAHRLATLRWADVIHVLEDGRLVESGYWDDLGEPSGPRFRALCEAQRTLRPDFATLEVVHRNRAHAALERVVQNVHSNSGARRRN
jgi:ATP-binding cassette subfamily C protein